MKKIIFTNKKYVHKHKEENVLIYNTRRGLPRKISSDILINSIIPKLSPEDKEFVLKNYSKEKFMFLLEKKKLDQEYFLLHSLPHEIDISFALEFLKMTKVSNTDKIKLFRFYYREKEKEVFSLKDGIVESDELKILEITKMRDWYISNEDKTRLSEILELFPEQPKDDIFYCNMHVNPTHNYFFEHPNEHVPGLMLIEAVRQFSIACCHLFGKVPLTGVSFLLSSMDSNFQSFLEVNFPIKFKCFNRSKFKKRAGYWVDIDMDIIVFQKNKQMANFTITAKCISKNTFNSYRIDSAVHNKRSRFLPLKHFYHDVTIRNAGKQKYICDLVDISMTGLRIKFSNPDVEIDMPELSDCLEFFLFFQNIGIVHGECQMIWLERYNDELHAGLIITNLSDLDKENLAETIKTMCFVREEREIL